MPDTVAGLRAAADQIDAATRQLYADAIERLEVLARKVEAGNDHLGCEAGGWWRRGFHSPLCRNATASARLFRLQAEQLHLGLGFDESLQRALDDRVADGGRLRAEFNAADRQGPRAVRAWARR